MLVTNYKKLYNETEIKEYNNKQKILLETVLTDNIKNITNLYNNNMYTFIINETDLKKEIHNSIQNIIFETEIKNNKDLLNYFDIKQHKKEIYIFNKDIVKKIKINDNKIFYKVINFLNNKDNKLNNIITLLNNFKTEYKKEKILTEKIKEYNSLYNETKQKNYNIQNKLKNIGFNLYYY